MGKNKRKILEDPAINNAIKEEGDSHSEEAVVTASKHKKHKKSKKEDQESLSKKSEQADAPSKEERDPQTEETSVTPGTHKKHKMSKKDKEANPSNQSEHADEQQTDKKKKKKKRKADDEDEANEDIKPPKLKKTKATNGTDFPESERSTASKVVSTGGSSFEAVETVSGENRVKKKKSKDRKTGIDPLTPSEQSAVSGSQLEGPFTETSRNGDDNSQPDKAKTKDKKEKKKHKKDKSETKAEEDQDGSSDGCQENGTDFSDRTSKKKEKTDKLKARESADKTDAEPNDTAEEEKQKKKDKKKKKKKKEIAEESVIPIQCTSNDENHSEIMTEEKTSKKKKRAVNLPESTVSKTEAAMSDLQECTDETKQKKKKKKKSKDKEQKDAAEDTVHGEETETDNRKQEQDAAISSGETQTNAKPINSNSSQPAAVGQWGSDMFNDNTRQNKFLRLLGGFKKAGDGSQVAPGHKKGLFGSLQPQDSSTGGQRALTYQAAQAMDRRLESDYERALSFSKRGQRGVGLGFQPDPAEGKKFHIDANRVASKKFDAELD